MIREDKQTIDILLGQKVHLLFASEISFLEFLQHKETLTLEQQERLSEIWEDAVGVKVARDVVQAKKVNSFY